MNIVISHDDFLEWKKVKFDVSHSTQSNHVKGNFKIKLDTVRFVKYSFVLQKNGMSDYEAPDAVSRLCGLRRLVYRIGEYF